MATIDSNISLLNVELCDDRKCFKTNVFTSSTIEPKKTQKKCEISKFYSTFDEELVLTPETSFEKSNLQSLYGVDDRFFCILCNKLLKKVCQLECGCRSCYDCLKTVRNNDSVCCPMCTGGTYVTDKFLRDKAFDRELRNEKHKCVNYDCSEVVSLLEFWDHREVCPHSYIKCRNCFAKVQMKNKEHHNLKECFPSSNYTDCSLISDESPCLRNDINNVYSAEESKIFRDMLLQLKNNIDKYKKRSKDAIVEALKGEDEQTIFKNKILTIQTSLENIEKELRNLNQLTLGFYNPYIWKISEFNSVKQRGITNASFIQSPPFYTNACGYKICLKLYPNGDGKAQNQYLSLYMVLLKGKYDSLLNWPFSKMFTLTILNQTGGKDRSLTMKPDSKCKSFCRPETEANRATGDPQFTKLCSLEHDKFLVDDALFIKFKVET